MSNASPWLPTQTGQCRHRRGGACTTSRDTACRGRPSTCQAMIRVCARPAFTRPCERTVEPTRPTWQEAPCKGEVVSARRPWNCWPRVGLSHTERWRFEVEILVARAGHICSSCVYPLCDRAPVGTPRHALTGLATPRDPVYGRSGRRRWSAAIRCQNSGDGVRFRASHW